MPSEPALTGGGGFAEAGGGFPLKSRPLLPPPSRPVPGPGPPPPGLAAAERGLPRRTGRTGTSLDRIRGSVMERDRPALPPDAMRRAGVCLWGRFGAGECDGSSIWWQGGRQAAPLAD